MKVCFDTSTLVAALLQQHPHHAIAFPSLQAVKAGTVQGHLTTHGLAELFATLTALPLKPRLLPARWPVPPSECAHENGPHQRW
jgi:predicted nucleic acid-binding protein